MLIHHETISARLAESEEAGNFDVVETVDGFTVYESGMPLGEYSNLRSAVAAAKREARAYDKRVREKRKKVIKVRLLIGANAYACIEHGGRKTDIRLSPGRGAPQSLREYAAEAEARAAKILELADLARRAAAQLEQQS